MKSNPIKMLERSAVWIFLIFLLLSCASHTPDAASIPSASAPSVDLGGLSADAIATLSSLEKIDDYPFYVMHYSGDYAYPHTGAVSPGIEDYSCSLFATLSNAGDKVYGRNFDWEYSPSLLLFSEPSDGYASVSMVNLTFLGISPANSMVLADLPLAQRTKLLAAPSLPFDGMNEYGLSIAMAAIPQEYSDDAAYNSSKPSIGSVGIIRQILDHARDIDEALAIFEQYNIDFSGGPPIHYLLADRRGKAVLVEFYQQKLVQLPNTNPWHLATNHLRCIAEGDGGCWRYHLISEQLNASHGVLDSQSAMLLLSEVKQDSTQWSSVYNMTTGKVDLVIAKQYGTVYSFQLDLTTP
jgi:hypothetical protein